MEVDCKSELKIWQWHIAIKIRTKPYSNGNPKIEDYSCRCDVNVLTSTLRIKCIRAAFLRKGIALLLSFEAAF